MGTLGSSKTWAPYMNTKDCTKRFCTLACPQWCYIIFTPPPPTPIVFPNEKSQTSVAFSPLGITIIGVLAAAFILVSYYAIISKYCGKPRPSDEENQQAQQQITINMLENMEDEDHEHHQPWLINTPGLDEALIKSITLVKYHRGDGLVVSSICSVCLGDFLEDDSLRLLPKCCHAFHVTCIDTWLKSHSNCPLCRANIISSFTPLPPPPPPPTSEFDDHDHGENMNDVIRSSGEELEESSSVKLPKSPFRAMSDLGEMGLRKSGGIDIIRNDEHGTENMLRRSVSMDNSYETRVSISRLVRIDQRNEGDDQGRDSQSMKCANTSSNNSSTSNGVLQTRMLLFPNGRYLFC